MDPEFAFWCPEGPQKIVEPSVKEEPFLNAQIDSENLFKEQLEIMIDKHSDNTSNKEIKNGKQDENCPIISCDVWKNICHDHTFVNDTTTVSSVCPQVFDVNPIFWSQEMSPHSLESSMENVSKLDVPNNIKASNVEELVCDDHSIIQSKISHDDEKTKLQDTACDEYKFIDKEIKKESFGSQEILFQVEVRNSDCHDTFVEEIELPFEPLQIIMETSDCKRKVSSAIVDHDYVSQELSSHISLMTSIKTCDDMQKYLNMFSKFSAEAKTNLNLVSQRKEFKTHVRKLLVKVNELNENLQLNLNETSELSDTESDVTIPFVEDKLDTQRREYEFIDDSENGSEKCFSQILDSKHLADIGERIVQICKTKNYRTDKSSITELNKLSCELRKNLLQTKTVGVQAEIVNDDTSLEGNEINVNKRGKKKLLSIVSSSSESDTNSDDDDLSNSVSSSDSPSSDDSSIYSKSSEDENNNCDEEPGKTEIISDTGSPLGLNSKKYIANNDCHSEFSAPKAKVVDTCEAFIGNTEKNAKETDPVVKEKKCVTVNVDHDNLSDDPKLQMEPIVLVNKLSGNKDECPSSDVHDKEIDKLLNFSSIMKKNIQRTAEENQYDKTRLVKTKKKAKLIDMAQDIDMDFSEDGSSSESENEKLTEHDFLKQYNNGYKHKLLNSSSSDSEVESDVSDVDYILDNTVYSEDGRLINQETQKPEDKIGQILNNEVEFPLVPKPKDENVDLKINESKNEGQMKVENKTSSELVNDMPAITELSKIEDHMPHDKDEEKCEDLTEKNDSETSDCEILTDLSKEARHEKSKTFGDNLTDVNARTRRLKSVDNSIDLSSESDSEATTEDNADESEKTKRSIKPMLRQDQLAGETKKAQQHEEQRLKRLKRKKEILNKALKEHEDVLKHTQNSLILDYNSTKKSFIKVHSILASKLKPHQVEGVKFMYDAVYGSVDNIQKYPGSGCILAHCMGLGKTLQLIALLHTVISHKELNTSKVLVLCPKSTVMNWIDEIKFWLEPLDCRDLKLFKFESRDYSEKLKILKEWSSCGKLGFRKAGCLLVGYEAFRMLAFCHNHKKQRDNLTLEQLQSMEDEINETLFDPGPDLVICDEGHIIKNRKSATSLAVLKVKTPRRIILTGTPIQNNLKEYYSMVNFIKPSFLGTEREFANLYANPIKNGQHKDSNKQDIKIMKQRSFVLHKKLSEFVQRREAALLKTFLPEKLEYVLFVPMTEVQNKLYEYFLQTIAKRDDSRGKNLITDYTCLRKIWTHPKVLENAWQNANAKNKTSLKTRQSDDEAPDDVLDSQTGVLSVKRDWWRPLVSTDDLSSILPSNKLRIVFDILRLCEEKNEKCLIFSAFVAVLNVLEYFMKGMGKDVFSKEISRNSSLKGPWVEGRDFYRLDGKTPKNKRHEMIKSFNKPSNSARCFLISARAGGQGINLIGANRVILLDTSWNPSNDQQNIFRIFRLGQKKQCYVYRLLAMGTMEEKVYSRSVTKQAMSFRVVDEQQIDRHYSMAELAELYSLTKPDYSQQPVPALPQDTVLANLLRLRPNLIYRYHEHDSLLENKVEQELSEQEKQDAWEAYEKDLQQSQNPPGIFPSPFDSLSQGYLGHTSANYFPSLQHLNYNQYAVNPANLLSWGGIDYSNTALARFYSMLSNQNLLGMQAQYSGNVLAPETSSRSFPNLGVYGSMPTNNSVPAANVITTSAYSSSIYPNMPLPTYASSTINSDVSSVGRYFPNSAFAAQTSLNSNSGNGNNESLIQTNPNNLLKAAVNSIATTNTVSSKPASTTSVTVKNTDTVYREPELYKSRVPLGSNATSFLNPGSDVQITSVMPKPNISDKPVNSKVLKSPKIGTVYPEQSSSIMTSTTKSTGPTILSSKTVDILPSIANNGNISVRTVNAINSSGGTKSANGPHSKNSADKIEQRILPGMKMSIETKRTQSKDITPLTRNSPVNSTILLSPTKLSSSSITSNKPTPKSSSTSTSNPTSLVSKQVEKRNNTPMLTLRNLSQSMSITPTSNLLSTNQTRTTDTKSQALTQNKQTVVQAFPNFKQVSITNDTKNTITASSKGTKSDKRSYVKQMSKFPLASAGNNGKLHNTIKSIPLSTVGQYNNITSTKPAYTIAATKTADQNSMMMKQNSGMVINVPSNNNPMSITKSQTKAKISELGIKASQASSVQVKKNHSLEKLPSTLNTISRRNEINIRSVDKLNKLSHTGLTISTNRKTNPSSEAQPQKTQLQNIINAVQSTAWKTNVSRKRTSQTNSSPLPEGSFSMQRLKKPRLMNVSATKDNLKVQLSQSDCARGNDVSSNQRGCSISAKPAEVVEID